MIKACVRARIVTGSYILQRDLSKFYGNRENQDCNIRKDDTEDVEHFILRGKSEFTGCSEWNWNFDLELNQW